MRIGMCCAVGLMGAMGLAAQAAVAENNSSLAPLIPLFEPGPFNYDITGIALDSSRAEMVAGLSGA